MAGGMERDVLVNPGQLSQRFQLFIYIGIVFQLEETVKVVFIILQHADSFPFEQ
jgi:hypothetical protein